MKHINIILLIYSFVSFFTFPSAGSDSNPLSQESYLRITPSIEKRRDLQSGTPDLDLPLLLREDDEEDFNIFIEQTQGSIPVETDVLRPTESDSKEIIVQQELNLQPAMHPTLPVLSIGESGMRMTLPPSLGLSVDGGGIRGLIPALWLEELENQLEENSTYNKKSDGLYKIFDYVGGTSIGGILALGIAADLKPSQFVTLFKQEGHSIFSRSGRSFISSLDIFGLFVPRYNPQNLESILQQYFGDMPLQETKTNILVTACTTEGHPCIFKKIGNYDHKLWQVARSTSAAPTYFPAYHFPQAQSFLTGNAQNDRPYFVDGGLWCNNPSPLIAATLVKEYQAGIVQNIRLLSLGTGEAPASLIPNKGGKVQALWHGRAILDAFMTSHNCGNDNIMSQIFGNNYYRINPKLKEPIGLDNTSSEAMRELERAVLEEKRSKKCLKKFIKDTKSIINKKLESWPN